VNVARAPQRRRSEPRRANVTRELVERRAAEVKRRAFAFVDETDVIARVSLAELGRLAAGWTATLQEQGVRPGERVVVLADEGSAWCGAVFGVLKAGAIAVPCAPSLMPGDLAAFVQISEARRIVASTAARKIVATVEAAPPALWLEEVEPADRALAAAVETYETYTDDVALLLPMRDENGRAQLAAHTHDSTLRGASRSRHWLGAGRRDRVWCTAEPGSADFVMTVFGAWAQGAEVVLHEPIPDPTARLEMLELLRVTILVQSAAEYRSLAGAKARTDQDLSGVREAVCLGDPVPAAAHAAFRDRFDLWIRTCYGRPESGVVAADPRAATGGAGSLGVPLPGSRVGVIDEAGAEVEPGEAGDLAVRDGAPGLFVGYWDDREATEGAFRGNWFLTGDLAVREPDDAVRLAFPAEVRALDDRRQAAAEELERLRLEELRLEQERQAEELRLREEEEARKLEERRLREEERQARAAERAERDRAKAAARQVEEEERRRMVELEAAASKKREAEAAAKRKRLREEQEAQKEAQKAAQEQTQAAQQELIDARARKQLQRRDQEEVEQRRRRELEDEERRDHQEARRAAETERRRAEEERKRQQALEREQARARLEAEKRREHEERREAEEQRRAGEGGRRRAEEERKRQQALEREQAKVTAEVEKREREEARRLAEEQRREEEAERRRAEDALKRQEALEREQVQARAEEEKRRAEEARRAEETERARAAEERKRQEALKREQERTRAEIEKREREEERRAEEAERRRAAEERKRQQALEREQERQAAEVRRRAEAEEKKAADAERRRAEEERKRQEAVDRAQAEPRRPRLPHKPLRKRASKQKAEDGADSSIVTRIGAYGIEPKDRPPPEDDGPNSAA
jgi:acyl-coenzyme A synthetase/AMP-(fatty) acid ligase